MGKKTGLPALRHLSRRQSARLSVGGGRGAFAPAPSDWTSAHREGVFRALPPSSGRRLRPRSPSPVPWRRRWRRKSKMKTATASAGICASWTKACGGKGCSAAGSGPRVPQAAAVDSKPPRSRGATAPPGRHTDAVWLPAALLRRNCSSEVPGPTSPHSFPPWPSE